MKTNLLSSRRRFLTTVTLAGIGSQLAAQGTPKAAKFKMHFAPHPNMFKEHGGADVLDQIRFASDQGFTAWEDNNLYRLEPAMQEKVGKLLSHLKMKMGVFVAYFNQSKPSFTRPTPADRKEILQKMKDSVEISKRCGAEFFTVVPATVDTSRSRLAPGYQFANAVDLLRECCEILEPAKKVMVLEPLNWHTNHGGVFLEHSDQAYAICRAVNSPSCKILFDLYHQQIAEGNLIPNIDLCWKEIGYFQSGDNPGRKEPTTGEINYQKIFQHIHDKSKAEGKEFIIGMEHGNSKKGKEGELAVIEAYRKTDAR